MPTRIEKLSNNSTMYYRGDTCMEISPFTNYYLFTIYKESNDDKTDDHIPLNLTNLGTIWLSFMSGGAKIRIPNYTEAENVDMANGEVIFRISEETASRILALSTKTFYISSAITDGNTKSDETVLFSGSWSEYSVAMKSALTDTVQQLTTNVRALEDKIISDTNEWTAKLEDAESEISSLKSERDVLSAQITELNNKITSLESQLSELNASYIDATILDSMNTSIPMASSDVQNSTSTLKDIRLENNAKSLEKSSLKSTFSYN